MNKKTRKDVKIQSGVYNTMFATPTRCRKSVSCIVPNLLTYPVSMIVLDSEGKNFEESDLRDANLIADILTTPASKLRKGKGKNDEYKELT
jgi:type IV secretory pathway TraG/TraD family ATPase VirD4